MYECVSDSTLETIPSTITEDNVYNRSVSVYNNKIENVFDRDNPVNMSQSGQGVIVKFDSACSRNMSGVQGRIGGAHEPSSDISISGFNRSQSSVTLVGQTS